MYRSVYNRVFALSHCRTVTLATTLVRASSVCYPFVSFALSHSCLNHNLSSAVGNIAVVQTQSILLPAVPHGKCGGNAELKQSLAIHFRKLHFFISCSSCLGSLPFLPFRSRNSAVSVGTPVAQLFSSPTISSPGAHPNTTNFTWVLGFFSGCVSTTYAAYIVIVLHL